MTWVLLWFGFGVLVGLSRARVYPGPQDSVRWGLIWAAAWPALWFAEATFGE